MKEVFETLRRSIRLTPARAFVLGTGCMLLLPERTFAWLSLSYHEFTLDTTYAVEEVPQVNASTTPPQEPRSKSN